MTGVIPCQPVNPVEYSPLPDRPHVPRFVVELRAGSGRTTGTTLRDYPGALKFLTDLREAWEPFLGVFVRHTDSGFVVELDGKYVFSAVIVEAAP